MPTLQRVVDANRRRQVGIARRAAAALAGLWKRVDSKRIAASWQEQIPNAVAILAASQEIAAGGADEYTDAALKAQGATATASGLVLAQWFSGVASDGRSLSDLMYQPAIATLIGIRQGAPVKRAMAGGALKLDTIARTQVADAGRVAGAVAITARPTVTGYVRMLSLPSCSRCILLAGQTYKWNQGFLRHPRCDCRHIPAAENVDDVTTDPTKAFNSLSEAEQDRIFTKAGAESIRLGAVLNQVVNARRGMYTAGGKQFTRESTTKRGVAKSLKGGRLMPEQIMKEAGGNREEAIRLLRLHRFLR